MDLSGFAGLANQDRLEDVPDYRGTNSTDSDGDGVPDDEDDYPNDPYRVGPYQNEGIGHIILLSDGGGGGFHDGKMVGGASRVVGGGQNKMVGGQNLGKW